MLYVPPAKVGVDAKSHSTYRQSRLVGTVGNRFVPVVFYVSQVFFEAGLKGASSFAEVEFGAFDAHDVVRLAV